MRTLVVSNDFLPQVGGIQQYLDNILRRLPDAAAFAADHPEAAEHDAAHHADPAAYRIIRGPRRYMGPTRGTERALAEAIERTDADALLFATPWPLVGLGRRLGIPTAVCTHGAELITPAHLPASKTWLRRQLRGADLLYSVSEHTAAHVRGLVGEDGPPLRLLRTGVPLETFRPDVDAHAMRDRHGLGDDPVVVCVGRLVKRKGQDRLVEAWPRVQAAVPDARLVLVGTGPLEDDLRRAAARLPSGAVTLAGRVPWEELPLYHAAADVFAHPNRTRLMGLESEGFGVIFLEAQAVGRPVVAGNSGGAPEALIPGETGLLVDGDDLDDIAGALVTLLRDPERARAMGRAGRDFVAAHYDWDRIVAGLHDDLTALVAGARLDSQV